MKRLSSLALVGAFALSSLVGCSSGGGSGTGADVTAFCALTSTFGSGTVFSVPDLPASASTAAASGGMSGINEWGVSATSVLDDLTSKLNGAKSAAPTSEAKQALDDLAAGVAILDKFTATASTVTDLQSFGAASESLNNDITAVTAKMTAASDTLKAASTKYCK